MLTDEPPTEEQIQNKPPTQESIQVGDWWMVGYDDEHFPWSECYAHTCMVPPGNGHPKKIRPSTYVREKMKKKLQSPIMVNESYHHWELVSHIFVDCVGLDCVTCT